MTRDLSRLFRPRSIAVFGGGFWGPNVVEQCLKMGFDGPVWPVHPTRDEIGGDDVLLRLVSGEQCFGEGVALHRQSRHGLGVDTEQLTPDEIRAGSGSLEASIPRHV